MQVFFGNLPYTFLVDWREARRLVLEREERQRIDRDWLAKAAGVKSPHSINQWLSGSNPRDPHIWVRLATILGVVPEPPADAKVLQEFLYRVIESTDDPGLKKDAVAILRELSEKYS